MAPNLQIFAMILNFAESLAKPKFAEIAKKTQALMGYRKNEICIWPTNFCDDFKLIKFEKKHWCRPYCWCHHFGYSEHPAHYCTVWCRSTLGPCGLVISNPTSFLRPALQMAPTTTPQTNEASSAHQANFKLYMIANYAISWIISLNYNACLAHSCLLPSKRWC